MSAVDLLHFLRDPLGFSREPVDDEIWCDGLAIVQGLTADLPLRRAQVEAWNNLAAARAGLILGPPGTGKTHVLAWMAVGYLEARRRAGLPCRILVTAFTRNAIVNLLEAIDRRIASLPGPTRLAFFGREPSGGLPASIEQPDADDAADLLSEPYAVLGCTVWGLNRLLTAQGGFTGDHFHLTCIDEASQMVLSNGLMAISGMAAQGRVLVAGDDKQLPPIRVEHEHDIDGRRLGSSIYAFLQTAGVQECALDETFRLNEPLTRFPRERFYEQRYASVGAAIERRLPLDDTWREGLEPWEQIALDPEYPVCVLIHDGPPSGASNPFEARVAARLARALHRRQPEVRPGAQASEKWLHRLAIVSPHRAQNALIRSLFAGTAEGDGCVVETVDKIQGRERDALVVSYAVADPEFALAEAAFIFSPERLNVTVTRARAKLILILSRRLLEVVPFDEELVDKAETLREFVALARPVDTISLTGPDHAAVNVEVCVVPFDEQAPLPQIASPPPPVRAELGPLTAADGRILEEIRRLAAANARWGTTTDGALADKMRSRPAEIFGDLRRLQRHGLITLDRVLTQRPFWSLRPLPHPRILWALTDPNLADRVEEAMLAARRGRRGAPYAAVRDAFDWLGEEGEDHFKPLLDQFEGQGLVAYEVDNGKLFVTWARAASTAQPTEDPGPLSEALQPSDYVLLNHLEDLEARRINFGIFEDWRAPIDLAQDLGVGLIAIHNGLRRLALHGHVLRADEGRVRSRMAEMARVVRYAKQRFRVDDAADRPYLVRGLKVELRDREKPEYDQPIDALLEETAARYGAASAERQAMGLLASMLRTAWGREAPALAGFQARALASIFSGWVDGGSERCVIAADTGSGKTEAACLPIIAGAALDALQGRRGVRAILVYPRVRLATNQAQRLARYLAALAQANGAPQLTLGLQIAAVPEDWASADPKTWEPTGREGEYRFPFFVCAAADCDAPLTLRAAGGHDGADELHCRACGWRFGGWVGTKAGLRAQPPSLFLPTSESLHQWLHDNRYGPLFGDGGDPPRCVLADEIHLYTHIQGAQIGYALRRLLARCALNGAGPVAIGMSATLGDPARVWRDLVGGAEPTLVEPTSRERRRNPKGREYFFFVQPEVESRNRDVAGASTTIQAVMALSHTMRRRHGDDGGFRGLVFVDSIDKLKRLHGAYMDAEDGQNLAALRTRRYPDHPATGAPQRVCCGDPLGCDLFRDGECWTFAATDTRQRTANGPYIAGNPLAVARSPVFSGSAARIETEIQRSDLAFATASLEVGYDDPEMVFVYQHYAPANLASFIQRKGRAGRGADDRPVTGITLSIYSPRDSWYYGRPSRLLDGRAFEMPLNLANPIVTRGQLASLLLDLLSRRESLGLNALQPGGHLHPDLMAEFASVVATLCDDDPLPRLGYGDANAFLVDLVARFGRFMPGEWAKRRRAQVAWTPLTLFGAADLPWVSVRAPTHGGELLTVREDIALSLAAAAPGNASRRWGASEVHWRPPVRGRAPYLSRAEETAALALDFGAPEELLVDLPIDAREDLGDHPVARTVLQPTTLEVQLLGLMRGGGWTPMADWDAAGARAIAIPDDADPHAPIDHRSHGELRGFPLVRFDRAATPLPPGALAPLVSEVGVFVGARHHGSGLNLARLYWGADAELRIVDQSEIEGLSQTFTSADGAASQFLGYAMESEGASFALRSAVIDCFLDAEMGRLATAPGDLRQRRNQMLRYVIQRRARNAGVNGYEASRAAELIVAAADNPALSPDLDRLLEMWSDTGLKRLFDRTLDEALGHHPLLSTRRITRLMSSLAGSGFKEVLQHVVAARTSDTHMRAFLRSQLVHSLAVRLRQSFVLHGRGDERRVVAHAKLPIQFGARAHDTITIVENGIGGDGTTRTFAERAEVAFEEFVNGFAVTCPNAAEDDLLASAHAAQAHHANWRALDPRRTETLQRIGADLGIDFDAPHAPSPQMLLRLLYAQEVVAGRRVALYDVWQEVMATRAGLTATLSREPDAWEVVSAAARAAAAGERPVLAELLAGYADLENAALDDSLSPAERLADQVYRVSGRLCVDGCQACLHGDSDLMPRALADLTVSRDLISRFFATSSWES